MLNLYERNPAPASGRPLVGRERERGVLEWQLATAVAGEARVVMVTGEPGIGKTRLLQHLAAQAAARGVLALSGGASEAEGMPPYLPFLEALGPYIRATSGRILNEQIGDDAATLATIFPELHSALGDLAPVHPLPTDQARLRLFEAMANFLAAIAAAQSLVLQLDDLQWVDPATLDLLPYVTRRRPEARLFILGAYREGEAETNPALQRALAEFTRQRKLVTVALQPLTPQETEDLATLHLGQSLPPEISRRLHEQSEGNPFFTEELLAAWVESAVLAANRGWEGVQGGLPRSVVRAIQQRLSGLPTALVDHLRLAAIIGREFDVSLLAAVLEEDTTTVDDLLLEAVRARLIVPARLGVYSFKHDKIREVLYMEVSAARRQRTHLRIGRLLEAHDEPLTPHILAELAFHFSCSGDRATGVTYALKAAESALGTHAAEEAARHYQVALDLIGPDDERRGRILLQLGDAALQAGLVDEAATAYTTAHDILLPADVEAAACAAHGLGLARWRQDEVPVAHRAFKTALTLLGSRPSTETVRVLVDLANLVAGTVGNLAEATGYSERALAIAQELDDPRLESAAARIVGNLKVLQNDFPAGIALLEHALTTAQRVDDPAEAAECCAGLMLAHYWRGQIASAREYALQRLEAARRYREVYALRHIDSWLAFFDALLSNWEPAEEALARAESIVERLPSAEPLAFLHLIRGFIRYQRGEHAEAVAEFESAMAIFRRRGAGELTMQLGVLALAQLALGRQDAALQSMAELDDLLDAAPPGSLVTGPGLCFLTQASLMLEDVARARRYYPRLRAFEGLCFHWYLADMVLAGVETRSSDWAAAERHLDRAEAATRREGLRPTLARILVARADLELARRGHTAAPQVRAQLEQALLLANDLDMHAHATTIRAKLQALPPAPGRSAQRSLPVGLSPREVEVLRLVAAGKSNRQIAQELCLSEKTVGNHLTSILNKTTSENRAAAAAFAIRHGIA